MSNTVTVTVSGVLLRLPSLTMSRNSRVAPPGPTSGAVKVGLRAGWPLPA